MIDARTLQINDTQTLSTTVHADAVVWRTEQLRRYPLADDLC